MKIFSLFSETRFTESACELSTRCCCCVVVEGAAYVGTCPYEVCVLVQICACVTLEVAAIY